ncbi:MAG: type VI secretion system tip protein VgrG [Sandaracinaceae bacterium]|nr:type VI secretion system tip protein VgrG [Sandaracinaceae bacterium]
MSTDEDAVEWVDAWLASTAFDGAGMRVRRCRARSGLSTLFEVELTFTRDEELPADRDTVQEILRSPCAVAFGERGDVGDPMYGVLREWELLDCVPGHTSTYRAVLVPRLWYLTRTVRSRVFQEMSVPDIVAAVLTEAGLAEGAAFERALVASYPTLEYVVQWEESDFDFVARLLEREGIFFYFDFAGGTDKVVFGDSNDAFRDAPEPTLAYVTRAGFVAGRDGLRTLTRRHRVVSHRLVVRDSNYRTPLVPLQTEAVVHADGVGLVALYGDHFEDESRGARVATVRAQERAVEEELLFGAGTARSVVPGQIVEITGHPLGELDQQRFVVVSVERDRAGAAADGDRLALLPRGVAYRPPRVTPRPRIEGLMHARIDGAADRSAPLLGAVPKLLGGGGGSGVAAPIDDQGRYRVLLPFDGVGAPGGRATRWIRRIQVYAGPAYGMHFPLHVGTEVLIAHLGGDPDRPVIVGAVPNPATQSPVTADNATQSVVRTKGNIVTEWEDDA